MYYPGYSEAEYVSEIISILQRDYGLDGDVARRYAHDSDDVRYYGRRHGMGRAGQARSPSSAVSQIARARKLHKIPRKGPPMETGYAEKYVGRGSWETVVVSKDVTEPAKFQGFLKVEGSTMAVWRSGRNVYAQTAVGPRHPSHWE